jgi:hypothetical protein
LTLSNALEKSIIRSSVCLLSFKFRVTSCKVNNWIGSYLSGRSQADIVEGEKFTYLSVDSGVPQSSVLGPSLILYYVNDTPAGLDSTIRLFADDTIPYLFAKAMLKGV